MQLTIGGKKYTFVFSVAATLDDDLLETVTSMVKVASGENADMAMAGKLPILTKTLFYGGLLQMHGEFGDGSIKSRKDADKLLFQYMTENDGKKEATLINLFNALYEQMGDDNFLSRIGMTEEKPAKKAQKVTPISTQAQEVGGES